MLYQAPNPHGGGLYGHAVTLDFSVNTNPLGTPLSVIRAVEESAGRLCQYPDPCCQELTAALAAYEGTSEDHILCGCGAAELIYSYCASIGVKSALVTAPTFSEYASALSAAGVQVDRFYLRAEEDFSLTDDFLQALERTSCEAIFLCTPNNPTGQLISPSLLEAVCEICRQRGLRLFADECFLDLSDGGRTASLSPHLTGYPGLFLLKAFTKSYGMAGLRLGYCLSGDSTLLDAMSRRVQPWNVSLPAQLAGVAALGEEDFLLASRRLIQQERPVLAEALRSMGLRVCPSQANYLLLQSPFDLYAPLLARGILIRDCSNYEGLGPGWYRTAVKTPAENRQLVSALAEVTQNLSQNISQ